MNTVSRRQALATAERLLTPDRVLAAVPHQAAASLAGLAGTALLHARLATIDPIFAEAATGHWEAAATHAQRHGTGSGAGNFAGGGLAASLILGEGYLPDPRIQGPITTRAAQWLSARALDVARRHSEGLRHGGTATPWWVYDTINGLAGTGRILLAALSAGHKAAEPGLLAALETLTTMIRARSGARPGWWLPAQNHPPTVTVHPSGAATTGLAHGIAGPLALLTAAENAGWAVPGQRAAIQDAGQWLLHWHTPKSGWPPYVSGDELDRGAAEPVPGRRDAWCYGTPGISRALSLAGRALNDPQLTETGETALASLAKRPAQLWDVEGPTLCHGNAGVLQCATANQSVTADPAAAAVTAAFDPAQIFAFQHQQNNAASDNPGLLTGAAGVALALADHGKLPATATTTRWDAALLLS